MPKPILVLPPRFSDDSNALWRAAVAADWPIERLVSWRVPESLQGQSVILYGEPLWAQFVSQELGIELLEPPLHWLAALPEKLVSRRVEFGTLRDARTRALPLFIKPAGDKAFTAQIYNTPSDLPESDKWDEDVPVLMSEIVQFEVEYRCFVSDGEIITSSSYWRGEVSTQNENGVYESPVEEHEAARTFAKQVLEDNNLPFSFVLDVGLIAGKGWAVIEANPAYGAGIYGCDPVEVLEALIQTNTSPKPVQS